MYKRQTQDQFNSLFYINPSNITRSVAALEKMGYLDVYKRQDYDGSSVNLGVAFTFTDFEYDMVNNIVKKSTESTEKDPVTGEYISETMESIAYQAMCFSPVSYTHLP